MHQRQRQAFTLVELLVVIGIIAILVAVLLPVLGSARKSAIQMQCLSNLRQFAIADQMYVQTYGWHLPAWWNKTGAAAPGPSAFSAYNRNWAGVSDFRKAMAMPLIENEPDIGGTNFPTIYACYVPQKWLCPGAPTQNVNPALDPVSKNNYFPIHYSYGMNAMGVDIPSALPPGMSGGLGGGSLESGSFVDVWDPRASQADPRLKPMDRIFHGFRPSQVRRPGEKIFFADAMYFVINVYGVGPNTGGYPGWHSQISNYDKTQERTGSGALPNGGGNYDTQRSIAWRHKGGANVVFFDGHGEWVRKDRLYNKDASGNIIRNDGMWMVMQ